MDPIRFDGKQVVVTGGASGIGKATAIAFAEYGAQVAVIDLNLLPEEVPGEDLNIASFRADVSDPEEVEKVARMLNRPIDILISNAGIEYNDVGSLLTMPEGGLKKILDVNVMGAINCARTFMPTMPSGGRVVFVSSLQAFMACMPGTSYQASKAALLGITKALAIEVADRGINVNAVCPAGVATEGMGAVRAGDNGLDDYRRHNPVGRRAWPHEIAYPILFLCSPWASYMTGMELMVDGGHSVLGMPYFGPPRIVDNDPDR